MKKFCAAVLLLALLLSACQGAGSASSRTESSPSASQVVSSRATSSQPDVSAASSAANSSELEIYQRKPWDEVYYKHPVTPELSVLKNETIVQLITGNAVTYLLTESGSVYGCGLSRAHAFAQSASEPEAVQGLVKVELPEKIRLISCGFQGVCAVGESETIYLWGDWLRGDETIPASLTVRSGLTAIPFDQAIADIDMQWGRVTILTTSGEVYAFGDTYGAYVDAKEPALWDGYAWTKENCFVPQKIKISEKIVQIGSDVAYSYFLGESGACYVAYGLLTSIPSYTTEENPFLRQVDFPEPIVSVGSSSTDIFLVTEKGEVYAAGINELDGFCIGGKTNQFEKVSLEEKIVQVADTEDVYALFLAESGKLYATGGNEGDWLLLGCDVDLPSSETFVYTPMQVQLPDAVQDFTDGFCFYRRADGRVFFAGASTFGQGLAVQLPETIEEPPVGTREPVEIPLNFAENCRFR